MKPVLISTSSQLSNRMTLLSPDELIEAAHIGKPWLSLSCAERLSELSPPDQERLAHLSILHICLSPTGLQRYLKASDLPISEEDLDQWVLTGLRRGILAIRDGDVPDALYICPQDDICKWLLRQSSTDDLQKFHHSADRYFAAEFRLMAEEFKMEMPQNENEAIRDTLIRKWLLDPHGFIFVLAHLPQYRSLHISVVGSAYQWQGHLFQLGQYREAANLTNAISFSMARQGQRREAEELLARIASVTQGSSNRVARLNLATLLREDGKQGSALKIYRGLLLPLVFHKEFHSLVIMLTEMSAAYRSQGKPLMAAILLSMCVCMHGALREHKGQAIAQSQLASTYRYLQLFTFAKLSSKAAIKYFRKSQDLLNLGRSLMTLGNIYYQLKQAEAATRCFDESLSIGRQIDDPQTSIGSLGGKARVCLLQKDADQAEELLRQAIALRELGGDHSIGVEYENMGHVFELKGNLGTAIAWYRKALANFEKYNPIEVAPCRNRIKNLETRYKKQRNQ